MSDELTNHAFIQLGGRQYPRKASLTCHTCQSPDRFEIEKLLLKGYGYKAISEHFGEGAPSPGSITSHYKNGHMAVADTVQREMVESRAKEVGRDIEGSATLVDHVALARLGVQQVYERIAEGDLKPDVKEGIAFANLLMKAGMFEGSDIDQQSMVEAFGAYMEAAEMVMTDDQMQQFAQMLASHPTLRALHRREARKGLAMPSDEDIVDAEVLEEEERMAG